MTPKAPRRLLFWAIAISLAVHLILAGWTHMPFALPQGEATIITITHPRIIHVSRATPPPHTPVPHPTPSAVASAAPRPIATSGAAASRPTQAPPTPTPTPQPAPANGRACDTPNAPAGMVGTPPPPDLVAEARESAITGQTAVLVHVNADGSIATAVVSAGSGNGSLDLAALAAARSAQYAPAYADCKAVAGAYTFVTKWIAW